MISINEAKRKLPTDFIENIYELYDPLKVDQILQGIMNPRNTTIRVNTIKYNIQDLMRYFKEKNIKFERVLWYRDALIIKNATEKELQKLEIYEKGYIYLQSLSSMVPPLVLNPKKGEKVLDLTAAPGSKTTQMACFMENEGYILANELDKIRCERLQYNVKSQGTEIVEVINGRGEKIGNSYPEYFDKVLLDTPCSGEGRFLLGKPMTYKDWSLKKVNQLVKIQKKLFESAYNATKENGTIVYSTCTINKEENEYILDWAINTFNIKLLDINLDIKEAIKGDNTGLNNTIDKAIKILPSKNMEGFFVAKIVKN